MAEFLRPDGTTRKRAIVASVSGCVAGTTGAVVSGSVLQQSTIALLVGVVVAGTLAHVLE